MLPEIVVVSGLGACTVAVGGNVNLAMSTSNHLAGENAFIGLLLYFSTAGDPAIQGGFRRNIIIMTSSTS